LQIAIEGCCHGELDNIYGTLQHLEQREGKKIDLLISCGDFQVKSEALSATLMHGTRANDDAHHLDRLPDTYMS
jgi:predicted phosphodiesterase